MWMYIHMISGKRKETLLQSMPSALSNRDNSSLHLIHHYLLLLALQKFKEKKGTKTWLRRKIVEAGAKIKHKKKIFLSFITTLPSLQYIYI